MIGRLCISSPRWISSHMGVINSEMRYKLGQYASQRRENLSVKEGMYATTEWADEGKTEEVMAMAEQFLLHEPQAIALGMGPSESRPLLEHLVAKALHTPYSLVVYDKENGQPLGFRLTSVAHRDGTLDADPVPLKIESPRVRTLWNAIAKLQHNFWSMYPSVNRVLRHELVYVSPCYQRAGIATSMLQYGLDPKTLLKACLCFFHDEHDFDGIVVESTSESAHSILAQNGYTCSMRLNQTEYRDEGGQMLNIKISPHDDLRLYFKDLRPLDDTPYYTRQWS